MPCVSLLFPYSWAPGTDLSTCPSGLCFEVIRQETFSLSFLPYRASGISPESTRLPLGVIVHCFASDRLAGFTERKCRLVRRTGDRRQVTIQNVELRLLPGDGNVSLLQVGCLDVIHHLCHLPCHHSPWATAWESSQSTCYLLQMLQSMVTLSPFFWGSEVGVTSFLIPVYIDLGQRWVISICIPQLGNHTWPPLS